MAKAIASYRQVFRLIFVIFFLFLTGDAFYRWDGFSYYATFSEFLPAVALVSILWSGVAAFLALAVWAAGSLVEWLCRRTGWKVRMEHLLIFISVFVVMGAAFWAGKLLIWQRIPTTPQLKQIVFLSVTTISLFLTWMLRSKTAALQERITPLVWLFGIWVIISVPLVAWQTWGKQADTANAASREISGPSDTDSSRPNIILVVFDTLTAQDMSVYGYERPTTPFISEWAKTAALFTKAEASSSHTPPTVASLMTGKRVWTHQTYHTKGSWPVRSDTESLPKELRKNGYYNMAFIANPVASVEGFGLADSFEVAPLYTEFSKPVYLFGRKFGIVDIFLYKLFGNAVRAHDWILKEDFILGKLADVFISEYSNFSETIVPPDKVFSMFSGVIDKNPPEPFFAWLHVLPPHDPYLPPEPYMGMLDSSGEFRTYKRQLKAPMHGYKTEDQAGVDILRARYDEFIRYCDKQFEDFILQMKKRNKLKNTVIIFTSDHGESFEHNYRAHGGPHLYEQLTHIPLIIKKPGQSKGKIIDHLVEQEDIAPTILDLADIPVPAWMEGRSLVPLMKGGTLPSTPIFSMYFQKNRSLGHQITKGSIAVWEGDYKLIYYLEKGRSLLFNLKEDPDELNNLFEKEPERGERLLSLIRENLKKANAKISSE
ncbi:MAG TPA: DUF4976 domain-containing protein [Nitrospirae bacterium]|nr:arylsulfatase [bacterium BMS3Abin06]HDH12083.1 DUF4976 domain-containing protein [Nitrospirota bacterium]HDZ02230.1 DUF4976 domain-containing protein [Nitrospirota bacterium]